jgi:anti-sigma factor RsiW
MDDPGELRELNQLEELIRRRVDGELDEEGERALNERLAADPSLKAALKRALELQRDLRGLSEVDDPGPGLTDRIMAALPPERAERTPIWSIFTRPIPVPLWLAASLVVVAVAAAAWLLARPRPQAPSAPVAREVRCEPSPRSLLVRFSLSVPGASRVNLVGDFNQWSREATPLNDHGNGVWTISIPLSPGRYQYKFLVDGERWILDPHTPAHYPDGFGGRNSLLSI